MKEMEPGSFRHAGGSSQATERTEHWNLFVNLDHPAPPWPWPGRDFTELDAEDVNPLPDATDAFLRYSPTDGTTDRVHVPASLPREVPVSRTALAVYHDPAYLHVFIAADKPQNPIPELSDCSLEDFSLVLPSKCPGRGFYFGMNQAGEHIGCAQVWDRDFPCAENDFPESEPLKPDAPSAWPGGLLRGLYDARLFTRKEGLTAAFRIRRNSPVLDPGTDRLRLSAGRACYAAGEWVSWGSPILWSPREDLHGTVRLVDKLSEPHAPSLRRLDMVCHPECGTASFEAAWKGTDERVLQPYLQGHYAEFADKVTVALNSIEKTVPLAGKTRVDFPVPDGWNRIEVMTAPDPVREFNFHKVSDRFLHSSALLAGESMPGLDILKEAFACWHKAHEKTRVAAGTWNGRGGSPEGQRYCLCHCGIFHIEPYLIASRTLGRHSDYDRAIRETCERMLAEQKPEGWFPCYCAGLGREPNRGDGGAFTNGSVGEGLALAAQWLGEPAWLDAAERAADYAWYRWENNQNYAAFALWHLAALYESDRRARRLEQALYLARHFVIRDIGPGGAQGGHNYFTAYGNITLKGLARLLAVLPEDHEFHPLLKSKTIRFANQILSRQQPGGLFAGRNRKYLGYQHPVPGLFAVAAALPDQIQRIAPALAGMTRAILRGGEGKTMRGADVASGLTLALAADAKRTGPPRQTENRLRQPKE